MRFLLDEMFPAAAARLLRDGHGHDAQHVRDLGLLGAPDDLVAGTARRERRALVTENVADVAQEDDLVVVVVLKRNLPAGAAQASTLATLLDRWASEHPRPYRGHHWPR